MDSNGRLSDDEWAHVYGAGGASPVPSFLSTHYGEESGGHWSAVVAGALVFVSVLLFPAGLLAVPFALFAVTRGDRAGWVAAVLGLVSFTIGLLRTLGYFL